MTLFHSVRLATLCLAITIGSALCAGAQEGPFLLLRAESLALLPNSKPMLYVDVVNVTEQPVTATVSVQVPASWRVAKRSREVELAPGEQQRLGFSVAQGDEDKANSYPIEITARSNGRQVVRQQTVSVATAPYFKPTIDGDLSDWEDAIPVSFIQQGKRTTIATYWNRRQFSMLVSVEEADHVTRDATGSFDAVQVVLAPLGTATGRVASQAAHRFEYLFFTNRAGVGCCCQLAQPGMELAEAVRTRSLDPLAYDKAQVAVKRVGSVTHYEVSLPMSSMRKHIKPAEGREFYFSCLVHDPDGTGVRDWGVAAGLWESQRNRLAWSDWQGAQWGNVLPMDCRTEWGMCSSKY